MDAIDDIIERARTRSGIQSIGFKRRGFKVIYACPLEVSLASTILSKSVSALISPFWDNDITAPK